MWKQYGTSDIALFSDQTAVSCTWKKKKEKKMQIKVGYSSHPPSSFPARNNAKYKENKIERAQRNTSKGGVPRRRPDLPLRDGVRDAEERIAGKLGYSESIVVLDVSARHVRLSVGECGGIWLCRLTFMCNIFNILYRLLCVLGFHPCDRWEKVAGIGTGAR